jgi:hypothetical protein
MPALHRLRTLRETPDLRPYASMCDAFASLPLSTARSTRQECKGPFPIHTSPQRILLRASAPSLPRLGKRDDIQHLLLPAVGMYLAVCVQTQLAPLLAPTQAVLATLVAHMVPPCARSPTPACHAFTPLLQLTPPRIVFILDPPARRSSHPPPKNLPESGKGKETKHLRWTHLSYIDVGSPDVLDATTGCGPAGKGVSQHALAYIRRRKR